MAQKDNQLLEQSRQIFEKNDLLQQKDVLLGWYAKKKKNLDFFSGAHLDSDDPPASRAWESSELVLFLCYLLAYVYERFESIPWLCLLKRELSCNVLIIQWNVQIMMFTKRLL